MKEPIVTNLGLNARPAPPKTVAATVAPSKDTIRRSNDDWMVLIALGLLVGVAFGIGWLSLEYVPPWAMGVGIGLTPVFLALIWLNYSGDLSSTRAKAARALNEKVALEVALEAAHAAAGIAAKQAATEIEELQAARTQSQAREASLNARVAAGITAGGNHVRKLDAARTAIAMLEAQAARHIATITAYEERERKRLEWRTLPQGHDTASEEFAAAAASALR